MNIKTSLLSVFFLLFSLASTLKIPRHFHSHQQIETWTEGSDQATDTTADERVVRSPANEKAKSPSDLPHYVVIPKNGKDKTQCKNIEEGFKKLKIKLNKAKTFDNEVFGWGAPEIPEKQLGAARNVPGVKKVILDPVSKLDLVVPGSAPPKSSSAKPKRHHRRATAYVTQPNAPIELVQLSQPADIPNINHMKNRYTSKQGAGRGTFLYHIEYGVAYNYLTKEFKHVARPEDHVYTVAGAANGYSAHVDHSPPTSAGHGTCTAVKAVGDTMGSSDEATLVVVKIGYPSAWEFVEAFDRVAADVVSKRGHKKKSVVNLSMGMDEALDSDVERALYASLRQLHRFDIPVFTSAGNYAHLPGRKEVDLWPQRMAGPGLPIINVGAVHPDGRLWASSQGGSKVFIHAMAVSVVCPAIVPGQDIRYVSGTSVASPLVAGEVLNVLSYDKVPFNTGDGKLVDNLIDYLQTKGSWERVKGIPVIWNRVTKSTHVGTGLKLP